MKRFFISIVKFYQKFVSPLKPPCCRFYPVCSVYAVEALQKFGALKGLWLAIRRVLKCNPWNKGGFDPVPDDFHWFGK